MNPDDLCSIIISCAVLHNIVIQWKQPLLEDKVSILEDETSYPNDVIHFEESAGHLTTGHYRDQFSIHNLVK